MFNISIFRSPIRNSVLEKEKPEIIRRVANCQSKIFKAKVRERQSGLTN